MHWRRSIQAMAELIVDSQIGQFTIALCEDRAPATCAYFSALARSGALHDSSIFRIVAETNHQPKDLCPIHIVQIGPKQRFSGNRHAVRHEGTNLTGISHKKWTVSAARFDLNELYGSFFVCMRDEPALDHGGERQSDGQGFAAFGHVVAGFNTMESAYRRAEAEEMLKNGIPIHAVLLQDSGRENSEHQQEHVESR